MRDVKFYCNVCKKEFVDLEKEKDNVVVLYTNEDVNVTKRASIHICGDCVKKVNEFLNIDLITFNQLMDMTKK